MSPHDVADSGPGSPWEEGGAGWGLLSDPVNHQPEVIDLDAARAGRRHDVIEPGRQLTDLETLRPKIAVTPEIPIPEPEQVSDLVSERSGRERPGAQKNGTSNKSVRRFRASRQDCPVRSEARHMAVQIDMCAAGRDVLSQVQQARCD